MDGNETATGFLGGEKMKYIPSSWLGTSHVIFSLRCSWLCWFETYRFRPFKTTQQRDISLSSTLSAASTVNITLEVLSVSWIYWWINPYQTKRYHAQDNCKIWRCLILLKGIACVLWSCFPVPQQMFFFDASLWEHLPHELMLTTKDVCCNTWQQGRFNHL